METGCFEQKVILTPDYCGQDARLSPLAPFTIFQGIAAQHAEEIGVGGAAMAARGEFWLTVHSRVDFFRRPALMEELRAVTWPEACEAKAFRCFRSYGLYQGAELAALGRTQWAILGEGGRLKHFGESGFPADFPFSGRVGIPDAPVRFADRFAPEDFAFGYTVRSTDIDLGHHMNNVAYVRVLLDCFPAAKLADGTLSSIEVHYAAPCLEGEELGVYRREEADEVRLAIKKADGKAAVLAAVRFRAEE